MNFQSYRDHLKLNHPEEDPDNMREAGQASLFTMMMAKKRVAGEEVKKGELKEQEENDNDDVTIEETGDIIVVEEEMIEVKSEEVKDENNNEEEEESSMVDTKEIKDVIQQMLEREGAKVSFDECKTEEAKLNKCLEIVSKRLKVKKEATNLVNMLEELKLVEGRGKNEENVEKNEVKDDDSVIRLARNLEEITDNIEVLKVEEATKQVVCVLCNVDFRDQKFSNLKKSLRRHVQMVFHMEKVKEKEMAANTEERWEARNRAINKTIGGLVYHLLYHGRPDNELPPLIYRVKMAGGDVGDINHSNNLVAKLLPEISEVVSSRIKRFMSSHMVATGSLLPCNVMGDKATDKRDSRHLVGILTLNPGGTTLFKAFFLGAPRCARGTGEALTASIVEVVSDYITNTQYRGFTGDGVYVHTGVGDKLDKHFGHKGVFTHDLMHKAALTDTKMRNPNAKNQAPGHKEKFAWLNTLTLAIGTSVEFIQWGLEWAHYYKVYSGTIIL